MLNSLYIKMPSFAQNVKKALQNRPFILRKLHCLFTIFYMNPCSIIFFTF